MAAILSAQAGHAWQRRRGKAGVLPGPTPTLPPPPRPCRPPQVRSNADKQVGFLADARRMNVAVTRARRHCALVADSDTVSADAFLQRLIAYFEAHGEYASAGEYVQQ